jgi:hypothetical protein
MDAPEDCDGEGSAATRRHARTAIVPATGQITINTADIGRNTNPVFAQGKDGVGC